MICDLSGVGAETPPCNVGPGSARNGLAKMAIITSGDWQGKLQVSMKTKEGAWTKVPGLEKLENFYHVDDYPAHALLKVKFEMWATGTASIEFSNC